MFKNIFLMTMIFLSIVSQACTEKKDVLLPDQMVGLLVEIHVLEMQMTKMPTQSDSSRKIYNTFEREIYKKFNTDKIAYEKSYEYYMAHPVELEEIYTAVVDSLNVMEQRLILEETQRKEEEKAEKEAIRTNRKAKADSTKLAKSDTTRKI